MHFLIHIDFFHHTFAFLSLQPSDICIALLPVAWASVASIITPRLCHAHIFIPPPPPGVTDKLNRGRLCTTDPIKPPEQMLTTTPSLHTNIGVDYAAS